jgi:hypothetical protein
VPACGAAPQAEYSLTALKVIFNPESGMPYLVPGRGLRTAALQPDRVAEFEKSVKRRGSN